jgi:hypothetical protein
MGGCGSTQASTHIHGVEGEGGEHKQDPSADAPPNPAPVSCTTPDWSDDGASPIDISVDMTESVSVTGSGAGKLVNVADKEKEAHDRLERSFSAKATVSRREQVVVNKRVTDASRTLHELKLLRADTSNQNKKRSADIGQDQDVSPISIMERDDNS